MAKNHRAELKIFEKLSIQIRVPSSDKVSRFDGKTLSLYIKIASKSIDEKSILWASNHLHNKKHKIFSKIVKKIFQAKTSRELFFGLWHVRSTMNVFYQLYRSIRQ